MKGILLCGGSGSRLGPLTNNLSKHFLPIYDKPMFFYSFSILLILKIKHIYIICDETNLEKYKKNFEPFESFNIKFDYIIQKKPNGIAESLILIKNKIKNSKICLILGDNFLYGAALSKILINAKKKLKRALIYAYPVNNPINYGVVYFNKNNKPLKIVEKPNNPKSNLAIPGIYFYHSSVLKYLDLLKPSKRGELEISDFNQILLKRKILDVVLMERGVAWLDTGNPDNLLLASNFVQSVQKNQGFKISCPYEIILRKKFVKKSKFYDLLKENNYLSKDYINYLKNLNT